MKERILTGWTFTRGFYVAIGTFVIIQAILQQQWLGIFLGGYFASMGLFAFGCAAGNCAGGSCDVQLSQTDRSENKDVGFDKG